MAEEPNVIVSARFVILEKWFEIKLYGTLLAQTKESRIESQQHQPDYHTYISHPVKICMTGLGG